MIKFVCLLIFLCPSFSGIDIYVARMNVYPDSPEIILNEEENRFTSRLTDLLLNEDFAGVVRFKALASIKTYENDIPRSTLDAAEICEESGVEYLLYGSLEKTAQ